MKSELLTNVPIDNAISLLEEHLNNNPHQFQLLFEKVKQLIQLVKSRTHFHFNTNYYIEKAGLNMGSPLFPILSCLCLEMMKLHLQIPIKQKLQLGQICG